jgi:hypothetical protein
MSCSMDHYWPLPSSFIILSWRRRVELDCHLDIELNMPRPKHDSCQYIFILSSASISLQTKQYATEWKFLVNSIKDSEVNLGIIQCTISFIYLQTINSHIKLERIHNPHICQTWRSVVRCEFERDFQAYYPPSLVKTAIPSILQRFFCSVASFDFTHIHTYIYGLCDQIHALYLHWHDS